MAFHFRLQKVLDHRQMIVDRKSRDVGEAARAVAAVNTRLQQVATDIRTTLQDPAAGAVDLDVDRSRRRRYWLDLLERRSGQLAGELATAQAELEKRRALLTAAWRDLEVLKKLKERRGQEWQEEQFRRESQDLDEIGQIRADRQRREKVARETAQPAGQGGPGPGTELLP